MKTQPSASVVRASFTLATPGVNISQSTSAAKLCDAIVAEKLLDEKGGTLPPFLFKNTGTKQAIANHKPC
ncbi:hypothetical protein GCM10007094_26240 [Pseudovibrio japonicus]|uniref:Uncharacterized protein n=1 Tax=Pseudovibrio japonicus TaxID=366534 RepID=A0ABQ3EII2_9HYPH|nr:hypothetical protein GCM10007094_26240 [Pseudovibrio japonicus]